LSGYVNAEGSLILLSDCQPKADDQWDAGQMGCGELVMLLSAHLRKMEPSQVLRLIARDEGAIEDIPAWCRLTGHRLILARHPEYFIERRSNKK
jgi:tRNA 2-thiouridine synthesizing protein A